MEFEFLQSEGMKRNPDMDKWADQPAVGCTPFSSVMFHYVTWYSQKQETQGLSEGIYG